MLDRIRAVFAEAQAEGMDQLYDVINAARDLAPDSDFQARFDLDDQPEPEQFLSVLEECCDARREQQRIQPSE